MKKVDITGKRFGRLTAVEMVEPKAYPCGSKHTMWKCACDCGNETTVNYMKLRAGKTKSCGCMKPPRIKPGERNGKLVVKRLVSGSRWLCECDCGNTIEIGRQRLRKKTHCGCEKPTPAHKTKEYYSWYNAKTRCYYKKSPKYKSYGARGIGMCARWRNSFESFLSDMGPCPDGYTLERIDVDGDYCPENCKWLPAKRQARNKQNTLYATKPNGEQVTIKALAKSRGINYYTLRAAFRRGEDVFTFKPRAW